MTEPVDTPGRRGDQIKEMELKLHPELKETLVALCSDPKTTIVVLSGSERNVLDEVLFLVSSIFFFLTMFCNFLFHYIHRILGSLTCGWQQNMECFYVLPRQSG